MLVYQRVMSWIRHMFCAFTGQEFSTHLHVPAHAAVEAVNMARIWSDPYIEKSWIATVWCMIYGLYSIYNNIYIYIHIHIYIYTYTCIYIISYVCIHIIYMYVYTYIWYVGIHVHDKLDYGDIHGMIPHCWDLLGSLHMKDMYICDTMFTLSSQFIHLLMSTLEGCWTLGSRSLGNKFSAN